MQVSCEAYILVVYMHMMLTVNGVSEDSLKKGDSQLKLSCCSWISRNEIPRKRGERENTWFY